MCAITIGASLLSLNRYWSQGKSPEGAAVTALREQIQTDDAVVSLHHSLNAAVSFYLPEITTFTKPRMEADEFVFSSSTNVIHFLEKPTNSFSQEAVLGHERVWLLVDGRSESDAANMLRSRCQVQHETTYHPFIVQLLDQCTLDE